MKFSESYKKLRKEIHRIYHLPKNRSKLLFHGWHHISFVNSKAIEFSKFLNCDVEKVAVASLVHDLNYIYSDKLEPENARRQTVKLISDVGYDKDYANEVANIIEDAHLAYRGQRKLSKEAKSLSDADTLFKALPTTPILFASRFITQNSYDVNKLAKKIVKEQKPLLDENIYFYTQIAKKNYLKWARVNLELWKNMLEALKDKDVQQMLKSASKLKVI